MRRLKRKRNRLAKAKSLKRLIKKAKKAEVEVGVKKREDIRRDPEVIVIVKTKNTGFLFRLIS